LKVVQQVNVDSTSTDVPTTTMSSATGRPVIGGGGLAVDASDAQIIGESFLSSVL